MSQRVVPEAPSRPRGGGRHRRGDHEVLAAIVFVATSVCTWQQHRAASFGPSGAAAHRRSPSGRRPRCGRSCPSPAHMAWLAGCRRLHRRYERKAEHFLAFTSIACILICCRRLAK
ncbi:hypothetical protein ACUN29_40185 (plasmid) [Streptomyces sp. WC2508]|uniref:hypothetical protein n=1 Tax=Streptomyces sp. WC2508 TaxID=3461405 RepID=UPI004043AF0A